MENNKVANAIANGQYKPESLSVLQSYAEEDPDPQVRHSAIQKITRYYRHDPQTLPWLKSLTHSQDYEDIQETVVEVIATNYQNEPDTLPWLKSLLVGEGKNIGPNLQAIVVCTIAAYYTKEPDTLSWLKDCAKIAEDDTMLVRQAAISSIADYYQDEPETLPWLKSCIRAEAFWGVNEAAIFSIVINYQEDEATLTWLKKKILSHQTPEIRKYGVMAIAEYYSQLPEILTLLKNCFWAETESDTQVIIIQILSESWGKEAGMQEFFSHCAILTQYDKVPEHGGEQNREEEDSLTQLLANSIAGMFVKNPRQAALEALFKHYSSQPQTKEIFQDRAENDVDENVRHFALERLKLFKD